MVRHDEGWLTIQQAVTELEAYKRRLGRNFDRTKDHNLKVYYFNRYNECENVIQSMCAHHRVTRRSKPHKLSLDLLK